MTPPRSSFDTRVVTVWCPDWPVTAAGPSTHGTVVVVRAGRVIARSASAAAEGVVAGQRRREAHRRCPTATILAEDPERDARAFEPIVQAIAAFTPRVEMVEPGWANLSARGPARYFGGEASLARQLTDAVAGAGGTGARIGIADGRFTAAVAAQLATPEHPRLIPAGGAAEFLAALPVSWLHRAGAVDAELVDVFTRLGLRRLGDLAALPPADVVARFGPAGATAHTLASGRDTVGASGAAPPPSWTVEHVCEQPIDDVLTAVFLAKPLAEQLTERIAAAGNVAVRVTVTIETDHNERSERSWYRADGLAAAAIVERVRWQLTAWIATGNLTAGVTLVRLTADETRPDSGHQPGLWGGRSAADDAAARAVDRLTALLGDDAVTVPHWIGGHLPGDRYRWIPASTVDLTDPAAATTRLVAGSATGPWPGATPSPAPIELHSTAVPVAVTDDTGLPVTVNGRGELSSPPVAITVQAGQPRSLRSWAGPWTIDTTWWRPSNRRRTARLQVVTDTGAAHLLITRDRQWWLHATYS